MRKALFVATVTGHIKAFHTPYLSWFKEQGWETHVASFPEEGIGELAYCDEFHSIPFTRSPLTASNVRAYKELKRLIDQTGFDIIHCHTPAGAAITRLAAMRSRKEGKSAVLYTAHGFHFYKGAPLVNWLLYYPAERLLSRWTDALITINKEDFALAQKKMRSKATYYIPGIGVDLQRIDGVGIDRSAKRAELGLPQEAKLLLSVGELAKRKNHEVVLRALSRMDTSRLAYAICGRGALEGCLKGLAEKLGLRNKVFFLGFRDDVIEICKAADVFVHPSIREGLGIAPLEAMACGLPLIASYVGGIRDYAQDGVTGCCVSDPRDAEEMRSCIARLLQDEAFAASCAERNREAVKAFSLEKSLGAMAKIYEAVLQGSTAYSIETTGGGHEHYLAFPLYPNSSTLHLSPRPELGGRRAACAFGFGLFAYAGAASCASGGLCA